LPDRGFPFACDTPLTCLFIVYGAISVSAPWFSRHDYAATTSRRARCFRRCSATSAHADATPPATPRRAFHFTPPMPPRSEFVSISPRHRLISLPLPPRFRHDISYQRQAITPAARHHHGAETFLSLSLSSFCPPRLHYRIRRPFHATPSEQPPRGEIQILPRVISPHIAATGCFTIAAHHTFTATRHEPAIITRGRYVTYHHILREYRFHFIRRRLTLP